MDRKKATKAIATYARQNLPVVIDNFVNNARHWKAGIAPNYVRAQDLPRVLCLWPHETLTPTKTDHAALLEKLSRALRAERRRAAMGHWAYDLLRHAQLVAVYRSECADFKAQWGEPFRGAQKNRCPAQKPI